MPESVGLEGWTHACARAWIARLVLFPGVMMEGMWSGVDMISEVVSEFCFDILLAGNF